MNPKVGDRVRSISGAQKGKIGTVVDVSVRNDDDCTVHFDGNDQDTLKHLITIVPADDEIKVTQDNLQKAYAEGCSDVKKALDNLFPGQCTKAEEWEDITQSLHVRLCGKTLWVMDPCGLVLYAVSGDIKKVGGVPYEFRMHDGRFEKRVAKC